MFCPKCGTQNADEAHFCLNCGYNLSLIPAAAGTVSGQPQPVMPVWNPVMPRGGTAIVRSPWQFGRRERIASDVCALLSGIGFYLFQSGAYGPLDPVTLSIFVLALSPVLFAGLEFGPIAGFLSGAGGILVALLGFIAQNHEAIGDLWRTELIMYYLATGVVGLVAGLALYWIREYRTVRDFVIAAGATIASLVISFVLSRYALSPLWQDVDPITSAGKMVASTIIALLLLYLWHRVSERRASI
jgi:zinc-ribbon domain